jgi:hypothetical protein
VVSGCDVMSLGMRFHTLRRIILPLTLGSSRLCDPEEDEGTAIVHNV